MMLSTGHRGHAGVEETRARILTAARELFERHGTRGTTTREVAERAGVNEATLFRHFGSKRALLEAMREQACGVEEFRSVLAGLTGDDLSGDLRTLAYHSVDHMIGKRAMMCVSLAEEASGSEDPPELRGPSLIKDDLARFFSQRVAAGTLRGDPKFLARFFMGILFSYVVGRRLWDIPVPDRATIDDIVDLFLNGVKA
ncbi:MAG TPA: TetR/AcrR family transcriptional regulator [Candidatus Limnocylindria bacterium]|jgi:AcrR family transcriptional regulator|nr:TetR/AcrR family transcriptional regulator [Candidatus Limnocylindria bacterium]